MIVHVEFDVVEGDLLVIASHKHNTEMVEGRALRFLAHRGLSTNHRPSLVLMQARGLREQKEVSSDG